MSIVTSYEYITMDKNQPTIKGKSKVVGLLLDKIAYGWGPKEIQYQQPDLTLDKYLLH